MRSAKARAAPAGTHVLSASLAQEALADARSTDAIELQPVESSSAADAGASSSVADGLDRKEQPPQHREQEQQQQQQQQKPPHGRRSVADSVGVTKIHESMRRMRQELRAAGEAAAPTEHAGPVRVPSRIVGRSMSVAHMAARNAVLSPEDRERQAERELRMRTNFRERGLEPADAELFNGVWHILEEKDIDLGHDTCGRWWGCCYHPSCDGRSATNCRKGCGRSSAFCAKGCCLAALSRRWFGLRGEKHWERFMQWLVPPAQYVSTVGAPSAYTRAAAAAAC